MAEVLLLEFNAPEAVSLYRAVNRALGVDPSDGSGDWPAAMAVHVAGESGDKLVVCEVWDSKADQEKFMERLGAALAEANVPPPSRVDWFNLAGHMQRD